MSHPHKSNTLELIESELEQLPEDKLTVVLNFVEFLRLRSIDTDLKEAMLLAQPLLASDWLNPEEDEAWKDV